MQITNEKKILFVLWDAIERLNNTQYVESLVLDKDELVTTYKNGFKQRFQIPPPKDVVVYKDNEVEQSERFNQAVDLAIEKMSKDLSNNFIEQIAEFKNSFLIPEYFPSKDGKDGVDGNDGKDADENKIIESLEGIIESKTSLMLDTIQKSIIKPQDGKDADEQSIIKNVLTSIDEKLREETEGLKALAIKLFNRDDLTEQVEIVIKQYIERYKADTEQKHYNDINILDHRIDAFKNELMEDFKSNLDILADTIANFELRIDNKHIDVKDGRDGKDADETLILVTLETKLKKLLENHYITLESIAKDEVKRIINELPKPKDGKDADVNFITAKLEDYIDNNLKNSISQLKEQLSKYCAILVNEIQNSIVPVQGKRGEKGERGERGYFGARGNSIIDVKINQEDHVIVTTDDSVIDAGKIKYKDKRGVSFTAPSYSFKYTNTAPTPFDVGGYEKGTRFAGVDMRVLWTKLLYGLDMPEFSIFTINTIPANVEIGYEIISGQYNVEFLILNPALLKENSITILVNNVEVSNNIPNTSPQEISLPSYKLENIGTLDFQIYAYDTTGVSFLKHYYCNYNYKIYYGEYTEDITDTGFPNPFIVLRANELVKDIKGEYLFLNIGYKWFCYPEILGEHYIFYEFSSDINIVFDDVKKITITNDYGLEVTYNCFRTLHEINEEFIMGVK